MLVFIRIWGKKTDGCSHEIVLTSSDRVELGTVSVAGTLHQWEDIL